MIGFSRDNKVVDSHGEVWHIQRRWFPRWALPNVSRRFLWWKSKPKPQQDKLVNYLGDAGPFDFEGILFYIGLLIAVGVFIFLIVPLLLVVFDLVVIIVLVVVGIGSRVIFGRPWVVEARNSKGVIIERGVTGWFASKEVMEKLRNEIISGALKEADPNDRPFWNES
ncbi:MAG TPA: hypothetical protein PKB15_03860 [Acidimicrobiia bacterium]|nr:hypothetical protein [Acidimicrobiia bacterium]